VIEGSLSSAIRPRTPFEGFFYGQGPSKRSENAASDWLSLLFFDFFIPSQVTFIALCKCLIYKENPLLIGFNLRAKPLISLKKNDLTG